MVQRRAARFIIHNYSPWAVTGMLHNFSLLTVEQNLKLVIMYQIVHDQVQEESRAHLISIANHTRGHDQHFLQPHSRIDAHLSTLLIPPQLSYGMNYPDVLLN